MLRLFAFLALALAACCASAQSLLRLGTNVWPGYEPLYLAAERTGWRERLNVRLVEYPSATEVLRAFRNKALEAAALTLDETLMLREAQLPVRVVMVLDISDGGDVILARPGIRTFADLRRRRIGVEGGALGAYVLSRALQLNNMALEDVEIVLIDVSEHESAYLEERLDAVVTFEPTRTRLLAAGAEEIFTSAQIPGEIVDVLVVHEDVARRRDKDVRALISDWFDTLDYMAAEPEAAADFTAQRLRIEPGEVIASYDGLLLPGLEQNRMLLSGGLEQALERMHELLVNQALLRDTVDTRDLFDASLLPE